MPDSPSDPLACLASQVVFRVAKRAYTWRDVAQAARAAGDWQLLENETHLALACLRRARSLGEIPSQEEVEEEAAAFRYARGLESAAATEAWLQAWHLSPEAWLRCLRRLLVRQRCPAAPNAVLAQWPVPAERVCRALRAYGACGGALERCARTLAERAAACAELAERQRSAHRSSALSAPLASAAAPVELGTNELRTLEEAFERFRGEAVDSQVVRREIAAHHADWVRVAGIWATFPTAAAAREAALCVRADGERLEEVAGRSRVEPHESTRYLADVEPAVAPSLFSATPGQLIGPIVVADGFQLIAVQGKALPSEQDPEIRAKAEALVFGRAIQRALAKHVRWVWTAW